MLEGVISNMRLVDATEWYARCYQYPCYYSGEVSNGTEAYSMVVSPGSYITLSNELESIHFIQENISELFINPCDCCE